MAACCKSGIAQRWSSGDVRHAANKVVPCAPGCQPDPQGGWPQPTGRSAAAAAPAPAGCVPGGGQRHCPAAPRSKPAHPSRGGCRTPEVAHPRCAPRPPPGRPHSGRPAVAADVAAARDHATAQICSPSNSTMCLHVHHSLQGLVQRG